MNMKIYVSPPALSTIKQLVMDDLIAQLNVAQIAAQSDTLQKVRDLTKKIIRNSDFIKELRGPELRGSFGIPPNRYSLAIDHIINFIPADTYIINRPFKLTGNSITGGWVLLMGSDLFERLKNLPTLIQDTEKGARLPWMRWTLEKGNAVIISNFRVRFKTGTGRSGFAQMIPNAVIGYRVPPQFAGTDYDNWITRTVLPHMDEYSETILRTLNRHAP